MAWLGERICSLPAAGLALLPLLLILPGSARADIPPSLEADMRCTVQGKAVVCHVTAKPSIQSHLTYARADVIRAPEFLKVLVGTTEYSDGRHKQQRLNLAFMAEKNGTGEIIVKVQGMVCADNGSSCPALAQVVTKSVSVGP
jgi:hypothetical protein